MLGSLLASAKPIRPADPGSAACPTTEDGSRPGYHSSGGYSWVRDCNALGREYYRVFELGGSAALIPRPDFGPGLGSLCREAEGAVAGVLDRYDWCAEIVDVDVVNDMTVDDALVLAHALNRALRFVGGAGGVCPHPMPDDVAAVCAGALEEPFATACWMYGDTDFAWVVPRRASKAMAAALNALYGIE